MPGRKRGFGQITRLPSKRYRARYTGPDGALHNAPTTFDTRGDAEAWLVGQRHLISAEKWQPPIKLREQPKALTFGTYAERWLDIRELKPSTRSHYRRVLDKHLLPTLADLPLTSVTSAAVKEWYATMPKDRPTQRAHAYGLLRAILTTAVDDEKIAANPCHIRGAGSTKRAHKIEPATLVELATIAENMPPKYRPMLMLSAWCALRFGEVVELRRKDVDLKNGVIRVRRGVARTDAGRVIGTPKSDAGVRDVSIPPTSCRCFATTSPRCPSGAAMPSCSRRRMA